MESRTHSQPFNSVLREMEIYSSKAISLKARTNPEIANLSFGEPVFGPPEFALDSIARDDLSITEFMRSAKRYEDPRGSADLRRAIAGWYELRHGLKVDPDSEVMVTHGGVEAITLAVLATTQVGDSVAIMDPSYMLYARTIKTLGRQPEAVARPAGGDEYAALLSGHQPLARSRVAIVNSPENPTGYVLSAADWEHVAADTAARGGWLIHDEVYDVMAFERRHRPARGLETLAPHAILINSFSKKFGLPGLRIGWMVAPSAVIELAAKAHDYLYLGVNIQYEQIALRLLSDPRSQPWLHDVGQELRVRSVEAVRRLDDAHGFEWPRQPLGAMFLFPRVARLYHAMPAAFRSGASIGDAVAKYLLEERKVAVVPGSVYGRQGDEHIRMVLCTPRETLDRALDRLG